VSLVDLAAALMLAALVVYALTAGADFGGGVWDLLARGPRAGAQRKAIEHALAPVWEANHVWLIFVVVLLFTCFPAAFAAAGIALHVPLGFFLLGIVLRGSAFVFRHYGDAGAAAERTWGRVFAVASLVSPIALGMTVGAITSGEVRVHLPDALPTSGYFAGWTGLFPATVGLFALLLFAFLAAVYLCVEADDDALREDFRRRALTTGLLLAPAALATALAVGPEAVAFRRALTASAWTWPVQLGTAGAALGALAALWRRRYRWARVLAAAQVSLILIGWGLAQRPYLIAPDVTLDAVAAPTVTLALALAIVGGGSLLLVPSLLFLFRVFKR
jgi:cytochrome d ubiquinol oxidase subunit II